MVYRSRKALRSNAVLTLLGTFLILTVSVATDAMAAGTWSTTGSMTVARTDFEGSGQFTATLLTDGRVLVAGGFQCSGQCSPVPTVASKIDLLRRPALGSRSDH